MSTTIDYYFNWSGALGDLEEQFRLRVGTDLQPYEGNPEDMYCRFLGMEFSLNEHALKDDRELNFDDYRYKVGIRTPMPDGDFRPLQLITMASLVYVLYRRLGVLEASWFLIRVCYWPVTNPDSAKKRGCMIVFQQSS